MAIQRETPMRDGLMSWIHRVLTLGNVNQASLRKYRNQPDGVLGGRIQER